MRIVGNINPINIPQCRIHFIISTYLLFNFGLDEFKSLLAMRTYIKNTNAHGSKEKNPKDTTLHKIYTSMLTKKKFKRPSSLSTNEKSLFRNTYNYLILVFHYF